MKYLLRVYESTETARLVSADIVDPDGVGLDENGKGLFSVPASLTKCGLRLRC